MIVAAHSPAVLELPPGSMSNVGTARSFVRSQLVDVVPAAVAADLQLAVSELVTNAFEHGAWAPVVVEVGSIGSRAFVAVTNQQANGAVVASVDRWEIAGPERLAGRGLGIVRALADHIELATRGAEVRITVHRDWA